MKKILITLALAAVLALGAIGFTACDGKNAESKAAEQAYGFSAATAGAILSAANGGTGAILAQMKGVNTQATTEVTDQETIDELNNYMMLVESLLSDGAFGARTETSDREGYASKMTVTYKDILGNTLEYALYYNETLIKENYEYDDDDGDEELEQTYRLEGIMIVDGNEYEVSGRRDVETEGSETENEEEFIVRISETRTMHVEHKAEQERDEREQEYSYAIYEGNQLVERSQFEYEEENNETEIELELTKVENGVRNTQKFSFERETERGEEIIRIKVGGKGGSDKYIVRVVTDEQGNSQYVYEVVGGGQIVRERAGSR